MKKTCDRRSLLPWFILCMQNSVFYIITMNEINGFYTIAVHPTAIHGWYESIKHRRINITNYVSGEDTGEMKFIKPKQFRDNSHKGRISPIAKRKISRAVDYLTHIVPRKTYFHPGNGRKGDFFLNFITLTLSSEQIHSDNEIKSHLLEPFLNTCRQKWQVISYIWRVEKQKNGNLHIHLITDRFIPWNELRNCWNMHQQKLGYITRYRDNQMEWHRSGFRFRPELSEKMSNARQYHAYKEGINNQWSNPNSTDVHGLRKINDARAYLTKYITKSDQSDDIEGRLWGCSSNLVRIRGAEIFADGSASAEIDKLLSDPRCRFYKGDYFFIITYKNNLLYCGAFPILLEELETFIRAHFPEYRPALLL
jgi:hypothetical protein